MSAERHYTAYLPSPAELERYEGLVPGSAARIVAMAERRVQHETVRSDLKRERILTVTMSVLSVLAAAAGFASSLLFLAAK